MKGKAAAGNGNGSDASLRQFALQRIYLKDLSFEAPNAPAVFTTEQIDPEIQLNLKNSHNALGNDSHEVVLHVSVHAKVEQNTIFLTELDQAGVFIIKGYSPEETKRLLGTYCPTTLFPYAREIISSTVAKGGFPPLTLQPINFDALYAQASEKSDRT